MPDAITLPLRLTILGVGLILWLGEYFLINNHGNNSRPRFVWCIPLDSKIPFVPEMVVIYLSTYILGVLPFVLLSDPLYFWWTLLGYLIIAIVSSVIYVVFPSQVLRQEDFKPIGLSRWMLFRFHQLCKPYDNFPSMHMAFTILCTGTFFMVGGPLLGSIFLAWALSIGLSTLMTKQHYVLDILSGGLLGLAVFVLIWLIRYGQPL